MGYNYDFGMIFDADRLFPVFRDLATLSAPTDKAIDLVFSPTEIVTLPFTSHLKPYPILLSPLMGRVQLEGVLLFPTDRFIEAYEANSIKKQQAYAERYGSTFQPPITPLPPPPAGFSRVGNVDISVRWAENLGVSFRAVTTDMSILFADSRSIEDTFLKFCHDHEGTEFHFDNDPYSPIERECPDGSIFTNGDRYGERKKQK